ncbi:tetratricopeptide repeat protein [Leptospira fluminis]|uniref:tetratricopeptide repeat protein n=1 Tax=Leptospira fluminis TaxID=2484979 RepID=UPI001FEB33DE|nr:tetratricopeptide repeat protein [Leptospira fluminis]
MAAQTKATDGWSGGPGNFQLNLGGRVVFNKESDPSAIPDTLNPGQRSEYALLVGEYLLLNKDSVKFANLMSSIKQDRSLGLAEALLSYFQDLYFSKKGNGEKLLKNWRPEGNDPYMGQLSESVKNVLLLKKPAEKLKCSPKKNYYSLCRSLRLNGYLSDFKPGAAGYDTEYTNLHRVLAPFAEESELRHVPFLAYYLPGVSDYLSELGLPRDAIHFGKIGIVSENLSGKMVSHSYEKLAYYYLIDGDFPSAEKVLNYILDRQSEMTPSYKNSIYLKLGALSYLMGEHSKALDYYLNLDFLEWSSRILHPFLGEPISINSAKDLVSVAVWKSKNPFKAVDALNSVTLPKNLTEDDLFPRLRIIQILSEDEPEVASKMAMDLSFLAQSKGWRRVEYSATLLHGFLQFKTNNLRKAIIEFTKAYGILKDSDPSYREEWIRLNGLFLSHRESTNVRGIKGFLDQAMKISAAGHTDDKIYEIKNYLPMLYGSKNLESAAIDFYTRHGYNTELLSLFIHSEANNEISEEDSPSEISLMRTHNRILKYKGFYPPGREPWKSTWSEIRSKEAVRVRDEFDPVRNANLKKVSFPVLAFFVRDKKAYLFTKNSDSHSESEFRELGTDSVYSYTAQAALRTAMESFSKKEKVQIYLNLSGVEAAEYLKKEYPNSDFQLFRRFDKREGDDSAKKILGPSCGEPFPKFSVEGNHHIPWQSFGSEYFDGVKLLPGKSALLVWSLGTSGKGGNRLREYEWGCGEGSVSFKKMKRRMDFRNLPDRILFTKDSLSGSGWGNKSEDFLDWTRFWLSAGTHRMYYVPSWNSGSESDINLTERFAHENGESIPGTRVLKLVRHLE